MARGAGGPGFDGGRGGAMAMGAARGGVATLPLTTDLMSFLSFEGTGGGMGEGGGGSKPLFLRERGLSSIESSRDFLFLSFSFLSDFQSRSRSSVRSVGDVVVGDVESESEDEGEEDGEDEEGEEELEGGKAMTRGAGHRLAASSSSSLAMADASSVAALRSANLRRLSNFSRSRSSFFCFASRSSFSRALFSFSNFFSTFMASARSLSEPTRKSRKAWV